MRHQHWEISVARTSITRLRAFPCALIPGYAADGYARGKGVGCCVVTFTVGGLSVINAIAGVQAPVGRSPAVLLTRHYAVIQHHAATPA